MEMGWKKENQKIVLKQMMPKLIRIGKEYVTQMKKHSTWEQEINTITSHGKSLKSE